MSGKETATIELTQEQRQELSGPEPMARDPQTNERYFLAKAEVYERIKGVLYDDSPWTPEEADALALEAGKSLGWDEMDEYD